MTETPKLEYRSPASTSVEPPKVLRAGAALGVTMSMLTALLFAVHRADLFLMYLVVLVVLLANCAGLVCTLVGWWTARARVDRALFLVGIAGSSFALLGCWWIAKYHYDQIQCCSA